MAEETREGEDRAWAEVLARWQDEAAHRAFLDGCRDLDALARAGGRYREVLERRPADGVALRWRDEVVRRATVAGLASLPRGATDLPRLPAWVRPALIGLLAVLVVALTFVLLRSVSTWGRP